MEKELLKKIRLPCALQKHKTCYRNRKTLLKFWISQWNTEHVFMIKRWIDDVDRNAFRNVIYRKRYRQTLHVVYTNFQFFNRKIRKYCMIRTYNILNNHYSYWKWINNVWCLKYNKILHWIVDTCTIIRPWTCVTAIHAHTFTHRRRRQDNGNRRKCSRDCPSDITSVVGWYVVLKNFRLPFYRHGLTLKIV